MDPELFNALVFAYEELCLISGEETEEILDFDRTRESVQRQMLRLDRRLHREHTDARYELLAEKEKQESELFAEINPMLQDIAREMGFQRPMMLELTRSTAFNAFVLQVAKEGEDFYAPSKEPMHVFINAGLILKSKEIFEAQGKVFTRDHLAGIIGHELRHLQQPEYNHDKPLEDKELSQRYEYDADLAGLEAMDRAGYNPRAFIEWQDVMMRADNKFKQIFNHYLGRTHPLTENRAKELQREFNRPDRLYFSTEAEYQEFSAAAFEETRVLTRVELREQIANVVSLEDWHQLFTRIEEDSRATFLDVRLAAIEYRRHIKLRAALAVAARELRTGEFGVRDALLHCLNVRAEGHELNFDLIALRAGQGFSQRFDKEDEQLLSTFAAQAQGEDWEQEFSSGLVSPESMSRIAHFTFEHATSAEVQGTAFSTLEDAFDLEHNHEAVVEAWKPYEGNCIKIEDVRMTTPEEREKIIVAAARRYILTQIAGWVYAGISTSVTYRGEELEKKQAFLAALHESSNEDEGVREEDDEEDVAELNVGTAQAFSMGKIKRAVKQASRRVATYVPRSPGQASGAKREDIPETKYELHAAPFGKLWEIPDEQYARKFSFDSAAEATPREATTAHLMAVLRRQFEQALSPEKLKEKIGITVADNLEIKDWLFRHYCEARLTDPEQGGLHLSVELLQRFHDLPEYLHAFPIHQYESSMGRTLLEKAGTIVEALLAMEAFRSPQERIGDALQRVRFFAHAPDVRSLILQESNRNAPPRFQGDELTVDEDIPQFEYGEDSPLHAKARLFERWIRAGLLLESPTNRAEVTERVLPILAGRARVQGLPEQYYHPRFVQKSSWLRDLIPVKLKLSDKEKALVEQRIFELMTEKFMAHLIDDAEEMARFSPHLIKTSDFYYGRKEA